MLKEELKDKKKKEGQRNPLGPNSCPGAVSETVQIIFVMAVGFGGGESREGAIRSHARRWQWAAVLGWDYCLLALQNSCVCCAGSPRAADTGFIRVTG